MVKKDLPDVSKQLTNFILLTKNNNIETKESLSQSNLQMGKIGEKVESNYNQLTDDHSLIESEIANLQSNFKECNQSIETLTNRLQSNYEDLTRFMNKGFKSGGMGTTSVSQNNNQEIEEEMLKIKNDIKTLMSNVKDLKRQLNLNNNARVTMTSSKTPSNDHMQSVG